MLDWNVQTKKFSATAFTHLFWLVMFLSFFESYYYCFSFGSFLVVMVMFPSYPFHFGLLKFCSHCKNSENIYCFLVVWFLCLNRNKSSDSTSFICRYSTGFSFDILMACRCFHMLVFDCVSMLCFKRLVALHHDLFAVTLSYVMLCLAR